MRLASHYDETSWKMRAKDNDVSEGNYCWTKVGVESAYQVLWFGRSRGKGVAEALKKIPLKSVMIMVVIGICLSIINYVGDILYVS